MLLLRCHRFSVFFVADTVASSGTAQVRFPKHCEPVSRGASWYVSCASGRVRLTSLFTSQHPFLIGCADASRLEQEATLAKQNRLGYDHIPPPCISQDDAPTTDGASPSGDTPCCSSSSSTTAHEVAPTAGAGGSAGAGSTTDTRAGGVRHTRPVGGSSVHQTSDGTEPARLFEYDEAWIRRVVCKVRVVGLGMGRAV